MIRPQEIYLIRHAQTDYNLQGIVQGRRVDASINTNGQLQAQAFFKKYKDVPFGQIFTSNLKRTRQTIAPFIRRGIPIVSLAGLDEISWGIQEGRKPDYPARQAFHQMIQDWKAGQLDQKVAEGESPLDVQARAAIAWQQILRTPTTRVLVCVHGRLLRILLCTLTQTPLQEMDQFAHQNTCLYLIQRQANGRMQITKSGDTAHLHGLKIPTAW
ncbi:MAG: histidine phosphatase family protein [Bernardetiaceae bacterium]